MLKLNTVNGKFDIVFSTDPLDGNHNAALVHGRKDRQKNKDIKSTGLVIDGSSKASKAVKKPHTKKGNERERNKGVVGEDSRNSRMRAPSGNKVYPDNRKNDVDKNINRKEVRNNMRNINPKDVKKKGLVLNVGHKNDVNIASKRENFLKKGHSGLEGVATKANNNAAVGVISREELHDIFQDFFKASNLHEKVEPLHIPGLETKVNPVTTITKDSSSSIQQYSHGTANDKNSHISTDAEYDPWGRPGCGAPMQPKDSSSPVRHQYAQRPANGTRDQPIIDTEYDPWGRPGCGAPMKPKDSSSPVNHQYAHRASNGKMNQPITDTEYDPWGRPGCGAPVKPKASSSPLRPQNTREFIIKDLQSSREEEYNPWGRPGCGAPLKDKNENVLADLKKFKSGKLNGNSCQNEDTRREDIYSKKALHSSLNMGETNHQPDKFSSLLGRGRSLSQSELQELQTRRLKELEHQNAIKLQVEEKRRLKQAEKERELREEQEAELRFQKEQEQMQNAMEEERRKKREQEEKKRAKQEYLEESIKRANLEAKKAKTNMRKEKNPGFSGIVNGDKLNYSQRKLQGEDDVIAAPHKSADTSGRRASKDGAIIDIHKHTKQYNRGEVTVSIPKYDGKQLGESNIECNGNRLSERNCEYNDKRSCEKNCKYNDEGLNERNGEYNDKGLSERNYEYIDKQLSEDEHGVISAFNNFYSESNTKKSRIPVYLPSKAQFSSKPNNQTFTNGLKKKDISPIDRRSVDKNAWKRESSTSSPNLHCSFNNEVSLQVSCSTNGQLHFNDDRKVVTRHISAKSREKSDPNKDNKLMYEDHSEKIACDYMVPFHRTETTDLIEGRKPVLSSELKKREYERHDVPRRYSTPDHSSSNPSPRQQQIIDQLNALRQGLVEKEREYRFEKYL